MPHPVGAAAIRLLEREEGQLAGAVQIPIPMFVMNRERFGRELAERAHPGNPPHPGRFGELHHFSPDRRRLDESPFTPVP